MRQEKWEKRDRKRQRAQNGMVVSNKSIFTLVQVSTGKRKKRKGKVIDNTA